MKRNRAHLLSAVMLFCLIGICSFYSLSAQNPNWIMPGWNFQPEGPNYLPLPQTPPNPDNPPEWPDDLEPITDPEIAYQGEASHYSFAGYTGPSGDLLLFSVDDKLYDRGGWVVGTLRGGPTVMSRPGFTEKLILPMGNSCTKFAIIFPGTAENNYSHNTSSRNRIYMGVYDIEEENTANQYATGKLLQQGPHINRNLIDISERDGIEHYDPAFEIYGFSLNGNQWQQGNGVKGYKIAATKLIDGCFRYVFINDGLNLIRYKLTEDDLEFDDYVFDLTFANNQRVRTEMELIELDNGTIRIAIPGVGPTNVNYELKVLDLNSDFEVVTSSVQTVNLGGAEPYGVEFDASGRYLYFTHKQAPSLPNSLDIWDTETEAFVSATIPTSMESFRQSFIERYGDDLFLASDANIGLLPDASNPAASLAAFAPTHQGVAPGYGSDALLGPTMMRYMLPDQVDDDDYGDFGSFSCNCCQVFGASGTMVDNLSTPESQTWTPLDNPFNGGTGAEVTIRDELRIEAGGDINIHDMIFHFKPGARVVIERGAGTVPGAMLTLKNSTLTLDRTCSDKEFGECTPPILSAPMSGNPEIPEPDECEATLWQGVELQGYDDKEQVSPLWDPSGPLKPSFGFTHQGKFYMYDDSRIEFAATGLTVGSINESQLNMGGGIALVLESTFKDNLNGIKFHPYVRLNNSGNEVNNVSTVLNSTFLITDDFLSPLQDYIPGEFVKLAGISGIRLLGNHYENAASWNDGHNAGAGVMAFQSAADISFYCPNGPLSPCINPVKSKFIGLNWGVRASNHQSNRKLQVKACEFEMNRIGIHLTSLINPEILDNNFIIPRQSNRFGLWMLTSTGYAVEGNSFTHEPGNNFPQSAGILVTESGEDNNYIYRNTFTDMRFGAVSQGVNGDLQLFDPGLRYRCNEFDFPIRLADILLYTGNISHNQGDCSSSADSPAGNLFSHTSTNPAAQNHRDILVSSSGVSPSNFEVDYRHHQTPPARLEPVNYTTSHVQVIQCTNDFYDKPNSCPVIKSSGFGAGSGIDPNPKSGDESQPSLGDITAEAQLHEDNVSALAAELDDGQTEAILEMIYQGAPSGNISELVSAAGSSLSNTVLKALAGSENESYAGLAAEAAGLPSWSLHASSENGLAMSDVAVSTNEYESDWKRAREDRSNFWTRVVDIYQTDTAGTLPPEAMADLLNQYQPKSLERFASNFAQTSALVSADWVRSYNAADYTDFGGLALPAMTEEGLPYDLPEHFEQGFFSNFGNVAALNALYMEYDQVYGPHFPDFSDDFFEDDDREKSNADNNGKGAAMIAAYPNPFNDVITFEITERDLSYKQLELRVFDVTGRSVWSGVFGEEAKTIMVDGREFPKGLLIYQVIIDGSNVENGKVMRLD